jgi:hypothetical protein
MAVKGRVVAPENLTSAVELVAELHRRQREMYAGGSVEGVAELLAAEIVWHVPGSSPIAGDHRGVEEVLAYFEKRRRLASATMRMQPGEAMSRPGAVAQFVEGTAELGGREVSWQTVGAYRVDEAAGLILEVWLVPLDLRLFEEIWSSIS